MQSKLSMRRTPILWFHSSLERDWAFANALPVVVDTPADLAAVEQALYGAWLCGLCLASVTMSLHHKLCHVLGGMFDLPHAHTQFSA